MARTSLMIRGAAAPISRLSIALSVWGLVLAVASLAQAQDSPAKTAELLAEEQAAFTSAAASAAGSVVQIETFGGLERVGGELISDGPTTGTIVGKDGWIISSLYSFRQQPSSILVALPDGSRAAARIVARDHSRELVLLKVETKSELVVAQACPMDEVSVGQWVIGLGRTFQRDAVSQSVGIVSALDRAYGKALQTDAKVSPVNYGGPLIDLRGRVIGVLAPISPGAILEGDSSQLYDSGIGFAVPLADILARLEKLQAGQDIRSGKLGIVVSDQNELAGPVKVAGAAPGSPAAKAGLKPGDTIVAASERKVELLAHLRHALGAADAGTEFNFTVLRKGKTVDLSCTLVEQVPTYRLRYMGIEVENLVGGGVRVTKVIPKSPAADAKIEVGMQILQAGDVEIKNSLQLRQQLSIAELDVPFNLQVVPAGAKVDDASAKATLAVKVVTWPLDLAASNGAGNGAGKGRASDAERKVEDIELSLGDFPNKAWAWCPVPLSQTVQAAAKTPAGPDELPAKEEFGLLILLPEPGEVDRNKLREVWLPLLREGWCVAV
ncbi:MAG: PDZ domain-containing protein, partial [Pirellulaceae bacterium]|nr:PDZ domain-containing protein [Pirellulaceae bacterium]